MTIHDLSKLPPIAEGGEGIIYEYGNSVIKIYKPCVNLSSKQKKVQLLIQKNLPPQVICPVTEVFDRKKNFIGYLMNRACGEEFRKLSNKKFIASSHITTQDILKMLAQIKDILKELHSQNIFIGDLNDRNILFDRYFNLYFIDCDSWAIESEKCMVAQDLFCDPLLCENNFNEETDTYAYCILAWKALTRIHPFGGVLPDDINITERMKRGISVIGNTSVKIPRTVRNWKNLSPAFLAAMKNVFENKTRKIGTELEDMLANLKFCKIHSEYYYGEYMSCPLCNVNVKIVIKPVCQGVMEGLKLTAVLNSEDIETVLNGFSYIDKNQYVVDVRSGRKEKFISGKRYYFTSKGIPIIEEEERFIIKRSALLAENNFIGEGSTKENFAKEDFIFEKKYKTPVIVEQDIIYYLNKQSSLCMVTVLEKGNSMEKMIPCSNTAYYYVEKKQYAVINIYSGKWILSFCGYHYEIEQKDMVVNYGIHYDSISDSWLIVTENQANRFRTLVLNQSGVLLDTDKINYQCPLNHLCISNHIIFIPADGKIRGYAYKKDMFKDFLCDIVDSDSRLIKRGKRFVIINNENIYSLY